MRGRIFYSNYLTNIQYFSAGDNTLSNTKTNIGLYRCASVDTLYVKAAFLVRCAGELVD